MSRRRFEGETLVIASHNAGKVKEIGALLAPFGVKVTDAGTLGLADVEETGTSFAENAALKARFVAAASGLPALADDSGLAVHALDGAPGIYSARWGGPERDFELAMEKVEEALAGTDDRSAHFVCALCLAWPDGHVETVEGEVFGHLVWPPRGRLGFGYDPIFVADGEARTFAEMDPAKKHAISHRARAFALLVERCFGG